MVENIIFTTQIANDWKQAGAEVDKKYPYLSKRILDCSTSSQLQSKLWIVNELKNIFEGKKRKLIKFDYDVINSYPHFELFNKELIHEMYWPRKVVMLGGWYSNFSVELLMTEMKIEFIQNYEIDEDAKNISYKFNKRFKDTGQYKCDIKDVMWSPFDEREEYKVDYDIIINTSCEHMFPMTRFYSLNKFENRPLYVLQSTDDEQWDDHINCVSSPDGLIEQAEITEVLYSGEKMLDNGMKRFMVIGYPAEEGYRNDDSRMV